MSEWQPTGGEPSSNPYGGGYGGGYGAFEPGPPAARTDGVSIAAFVCALTCCAGPVGIGLGIAGIVRTRNGQRRGRWAAVTGVVLGIVGTLALIAAVVGMTIVGTKIVFEEDARVGQCVNTGFLGSETDDLWKADCSEEHDAEVVAVRVATAGMEADYDAGTPIAEICAPFVDDAYTELAADDTYRMDFATDAFDDDVTEGDWLVCYLERADGERLDGPLADGPSA